MAAATGFHAHGSIRTVTRRPLPQEAPASPLRVPLLPPEERASDDARSSISSPRTGVSVIIGRVQAAQGLMRLRVVIRGAVQGVGFRPFIYRLATELALKGWVVNSSPGRVRRSRGRPRRAWTPSCCGSSRRSRRTLSSRAWNRPTSTRSASNGFEIRHSDEAGEKTALVLPDLATCPDCLREIFDPANRRYLYPFTNCTHCGPRYTIIEALPYDRPNTTMKAFAMCDACRAEYEDPLDRRFHAQPNACPAVRTAPGIVGRGWRASWRTHRDARLAGGRRRHPPRPGRGRERPGRISPDGRRAQRRRRAAVAPAQAPRGEAVRADGSRRLERDNGSLRAR